MKNWHSLIIRTFFRNPKFVTHLFFFFFFFAPAQFIYTFVGLHKKSPERKKLQFFPLLFLLLIHYSSSFPLSWEIHCKGPLGKEEEPEREREEKPRYSGSPDKPLSFLQEGW